jgi:hypothetical protein
VWHPSLISQSACSILVWGLPCSRHISRCVEVCGKRPGPARLLTADYYAASTCSSSPPTLPYSGSLMSMPSGSLLAPSCRWNWPSIRTFAV